MSFLDQVNDKLLSSASKNSLRNGCPYIEKYLDSEFQSPAVGSSTEVSNTAKLDTTPSSQNFGQVSSLDQSSLPELTQFQLENKPVLYNPDHSPFAKTQPVNI